MIARSIFLGAAACALPWSAAANAQSCENAAAAYFDADIDCLRTLAQSKSKGARLPAALLAIAEGHEQRAAMLEAALDEEPDSDIRARLADLVVRQYVINYDYAGAAAASKRLGRPDAMTDVERVYARFPAFDFQASQNVVEVPYVDGRIPVKINGKDAELILDTGASNIGIQGTLVEELGLTLDRSASRISRVPAYGLEFPVYGVLIDEMQIGGLKLRNLVANSGEIPPEQREKADQLASQTGNAELIMGLDALRLAVDVIEFDWTNNVVRLIIDDERPAATTNYVLNTGQAPVVRVAFGKRLTNLSFDSGAYGNLIGSENVALAPVCGTRTYAASWGSFDEQLVVYDVKGAGKHAMWSSARAFAEDEAYGVSGVIGKLNHGVVRIDMEDRNFSIRDYDPEKSRYKFEVAKQIIEECAVRG